MNISIALCTFNGEKYLPDQLASYLNQDRLPDELVICDDHSNDHTIKIVRQFTAKAPFPVHLYINENNLGSTQNFQKAFDLCRGDIIVPSDQDDIWHKNKLLRLERVFEENAQVALIFTDANVVDENSNPLGYRLWQSIKFTPAEQKKICEGDFVSVLVKHNVVTGATMAFRSHFRSLFNPIPSTWVHDAWITFTIAMISVILPLSETLIEYRQHGQNQVGTPGKSLLNGVNYALAQDRDLQIQIYEKYRVLGHRIESRFPEKTDALYHVRQQTSHRQIRSRMPENRLRRVPAILQELISRRYHRYSFGYSSAVKDFLV